MAEYCGYVTQNSILPKFGNLPQQSILKDNTHKRKKKKADKQRRRRYQKAAAIMDDNNIVNEDDDDEQQQQQQAPDEQQQGVHQHVQAVDEDNEDDEDDDGNNARRTTRRLRLMSVLERQETYSFRTRNKIDILTEEFLDKIVNDIHAMICDLKVGTEDYKGLDSNRDTEAEVETTVRFFPEVLTRRKEIVWDCYNEHGELEEDVVEGFYPFQLIACVRSNNFSRCNAKAVSFIPVFAKVAIELGLFEEQYRGGLLCQDSCNGNVLQDLMCTDTIKVGDREEHEYNENIFLQVLIRLRKMGLLKKEDIHKYRLLNQLCAQHNSFCFAERRFRFLVDWDPTALMHVKNDSVPLHSVSFYKSFQAFLSVFDAGIKYFPHKEGINLLFQINHFSYMNTSFQRACKQFGHEQVMTGIEDTLTRYSDSTPLNVVEALMTAAVDEDIHLDCVYYLIRREPNVLQKLLSPTVAVVAFDNNDDDSTNNNVVGSTETIVTKITNPKKRKRKDKKDDDDYDGDI